MALSELKPPGQRRVLGSPFKSPANANNKKGNNLFLMSTSSPTPNKLDERDDVYDAGNPIAEEDSIRDLQVVGGSNDVVCPICNEVMISLYQLNQHIDDEHGGSENKPESFKLNNPPNNNEYSSSDINKSLKKDPRKEINTPVKRKTIKLDLIDNSKEFSLSDNSTANEGSPPEIRSMTNSPFGDRQKRITRSHWKKPLVSLNICTHPGCNKYLNVKNGIVNCRKCGELFCNRHTYHKVKLKNSEDERQPIYDATVEGQWCRCCEKCYLKKPDLAEGTKSNIQDLSEIFIKKRQTYVDSKELIRSKIQKKFIKVVNLHADNYLSKRDKKVYIRWLSLNNSKDSVLEREKGIVGYENWQDDASITNCNVCLTKFNILIRKHHCRLCGKIVCDDSFGERSNCLINVPLNKLLDKLISLNYSPLVKLNIHELLSTIDDDFSIRCCINCKNDLLHEWKTTTQHNDIEGEIFLIYDEILMVKRKIQVMLPRYETLVKEPNSQETNKMRIRIMNFMKDFESLTLLFKNTFFNKSNEKLIVKDSYLSYSKLINNIYQASTLFLQGTLVKVKILNKEYKQQEDALLKLMKSDELLPIVTPKLTKKEIRELRESLMVMNEQKFLVENQIDQLTKQRKFDELTPLIENKNELHAAIKELECKLGNDGF